MIPSINSSLRGFQVFVQGRHHLPSSNSSNLLHFANWKITIKICTVVEIDHRTFELVRGFRRTGPWNSHGPHSSDGFE